jgi:hypothetical protein
VRVSGDLIEATEKADFFSLPQVLDGRKEIMARKPAVSVCIRIRNATGKQQICPAVWQQKNKKLKAGFCLVGGREEEHPEGTYNLRYAVNGVSKWETLEGDADDVVRIRMQGREQLAHPKGVLAQYVGNSVTVRPQTPAEPTQVLNLPNRSALDANSCWFVVDWVFSLRKRPR